MTFRECISKRKISTRQVLKKVSVASFASRTMGYLCFQLALTDGRSTEKCDRFGRGSSRMFRYERLNLTKWLRNFGLSVGYSIRMRTGRRPSMAGLLLSSAISALKMSRSWTNLPTWLKRERMKQASWLVRGTFSSKVKSQAKSLRCPWASRTSTDQKCTLSLNSQLMATDACRGRLSRPSKLTLTVSPT